MMPSWLQSQTNLLLAMIFSIIANALIFIWWRQNTRRWPYVILGAVVFSVGFLWITTNQFEVPDYRVGCPDLCAGWRGYPISTQISSLHGSWNNETNGIVLSFFIFLFATLGISALWIRLFNAWESSNVLQKLLVFGGAVLIIAALSPTYFAPPEPTVRGEALRLSINAKRLAFDSANLTWTVQRLALEDVRRLPRRTKPDAPGLPPPSGPDWRICLRSYSFFFVPQQRVYVDLDETGVIAIGGGKLPLQEDCSSAPFPESPYNGIPN